MPPDRRGVGEPHILIGGPGRSGTTLLVQYFSALGFETGYSLEQALNRVDPIARAGLEHPLGRGSLPYVAKSPFYSLKLGQELAAGTLQVKYFIAPVRELFAAAESRRFVTAQAAEAGRDAAHQPGSLSFGARRNPRRQEEKLAIQFYRLVHTLLTYGVPTFFLQFPDFALGRQSLYDALRPLLDEHGVTEEESRAALSRVVRPELIHEFDRGS